MDKVYDLIGGRQTVWAATESFYRRVFEDDTLSALLHKYDNVLFMTLCPPCRPVESLLFYVCNDPDYLPKAWYQRMSADIV